MENSACHDTQQPGNNREELVDEKVKEVWLRYLPPRVLAFF